MLVLVEMQIALGLLVFFAKNAIGGSELGHDEPASAKISDEPAENRVGNPGHGSENGGGSNLHAANHERGGHGSFVRLRARFRTGEDARIAGIVPEFAHEPILLPVCKLGMCDNPHKVECECE